MKIAPISFNKIQTHLNKKGISFCSVQKEEDSFVLESSKQAKNTPLKKEDANFILKEGEHFLEQYNSAQTEDEKEKFTKQLGDVLKHVDAMNEVDTSNIEPMAHAIDFVNVMREDNKIYENTREELMANAPDVEGEFFKVPKIN